MAPSPVFLTTEERTRAAGSEAGPLTTAAMYMESPGRAPPVLLITDGGTAVSSVPHQGQWPRRQVTGDY